MADADYRTHLANLALFAAAAIWGSTFFLVKRALDDAHPVTLVGYRFALAALVLGVVMALLRRPLWRNLPQGLLLGVFILILYLTQTAGLVITTAANSGLITGLFVAFVPLFTFVLFRRVPWLSAVLAAATSFSGLWVLTGGLTEINAGDLLTLFAAATYALHILYVDKYVKAGLDPYALSFQQFAIVGAACLVIGGIMGMSFSVGSNEVIWIILFLAAFPTLLAFVIQLLAQRHTTPVKVSLILAFEPVFAVLFAWTLGRELFVWPKAFGTLLIFGALVISAIRGTSPPRVSRDARCWGK